MRYEMNDFFLNDEALMLRNALLANDTKYARALDNLKCRQVSLHDIMFELLANVATCTATAMFDAEVPYTGLYKILEQDAEMIADHVNACTNGFFSLDDVHTMIQNHYNEYRKVYLYTIAETIRDIEEQVARFEAMETGT